MRRRCSEGERGELLRPLCKNHRGHVWKGTTPFFFSSRRLGFLGLSPFEGRNTQHPHSFSLPVSLVPLFCTWYSGLQRRPLLHGSHPNGEGVSASADHSDGRTSTGKRNSAPPLPSLPPARPLPAPSRSLTALTPTIPGAVRCISPPLTSDRRGSAWNGTLSRVVRLGHRGQGGWGG